MSSRPWARVITGVSAAVLMAGPGFSQSRGGTTTPTTGTSTSTGSSTTGPTTTSIPSTNPSGASTTPQRPGTLFITGRVMLEEGAPPPDTVAIERVCSGSTRAEGYTDSKGYFAIEIGNETAVFQDASETGGYRGSGPLGSASGTGLSGSSGTSGGPKSGSMSGQRYATCDLRARLPGYRSQSVSLADRRPMDDPNIGIILLHREGHDEGSTISAVSLAAPRDARRAFEKGLQDIKKNKTDEAEKEYRKAIELYPHYATAWNELGRIQLDRGQNDAARRSFDAAIKADPKYVNPYLQLSIIEMDTKSWRELADTTARALKLDPFDYPLAYLYNGAANWNLRDIDAAENSVRQAEKLDNQHKLPEVSYLMGLILMQRHDFSGAAEYLRRYLKLAPAAEDADKARAQLAQAEKLVAQNAATASSKRDR